MSNLFLPFTDQGLVLEKRAIEVKQHLGLDPYARVDPYSVLPHVPARLVAEEAFSQLPPTISRDLLVTFRSKWSAIGFGRSPVDGAELVLLNPTHHEHRQRVSLMEEIVHIVLCHPRVRLAFDTESNWQRPFDDAIEDEAYGVGAACIIPYRWLFNQVKRGVDLEALTGILNVSRDYVSYRIKRAGLYAMSRKRQGESGRARHVSRKAGS